MIKVSIVVPVFNEEGNVAELHREIKDICEEKQYEYEIIFVNDGSSDRILDRQRRWMPESKKHNMTILSLWMGIDKMTPRTFQ